MLTLSMFKSKYGDFMNIVNGLKHEKIVFFLQTTVLKIQLSSITFLVTKKLKY